MSWAEEKEKDIEIEDEAAFEQDELREVEQMGKQYVKNIGNGLKQRMARENQRMKDVCDSAYYFVVCFTNETQMREFLKKYDIDDDSKFINGVQFARKIGRALETPNTKFPKTRDIDKDYKARAFKK